MKDLLNAGQVLGRSEMKTIMAGYRCTCETNDCSVVMDIYSNSWYMEGGFELPSVLKLSAKTAIVLSHIVDF